MTTKDPRTDSTDLGEARRVRPLFDGTRLRLARELRRMSQMEVADKVGDLSSAAISQFERGDARPGVRTLTQLAAVLHFPLGFFAQGTRPQETNTPAYFRSLRSTSATERKQARALTHIVWQFTLALEDHVRFPDLDVPRIPQDLDANQRDVEKVAEAVRTAWQLPPGPIDNMVRLLEQHGVIVVRMATGSHKLDAFSVPYDGRPVVVLADDKADRFRSRFDAAHELGHLVMHDTSEHGTKAAEQQAHWFAAALLMPADDIRDELPETPDWHRLLELKGEWEASIQALLMRSKNLGVMRDETYVQAMKTISIRGWRRNEPGSLGPSEAPTLLTAAVAAIEQRGLGVRDVAHEAALPIDDVERIIGASADDRPVLIP